MTLHVVDASAFGPLLFYDERDDIYSGLESLLFDGLCVVPQHWQLEVINQLLMGLRRGRTTSEAADASLRDLAALPILVDTSTSDQIAAIFDLARLHKLTIYDAAYLELAMREGFTLVSYDKDLRRAAADEAVAILP